MKRSHLLYPLAVAALAAGLSACQQKVEEEAAAPPAADVNVTTPPDVNVTAPPNVTVNPPDVNINPPDVNVNPPAPTTKETTTVTVPGVGSTTTTTEKR
jgi:hypothetical protein